MVLHTFDALKSKNFRIYMAGQSIALIGMWMQKLATSWLVYDITKSSSLLGLVELLSNIPIIVIGLFAGAWIEKHDIKKLIMVMQVLTLIHAVIMAVLIYFDMLKFWHILVLSIYLGIVFSIDMPARQASLILMVNKNADLKSAIALHSVIFNLSRLIGPSIAGFIIYSTSAMFCFMITAAAYIPVIFALSIIKFRERVNSFSNRKNIFGDIADVIKYSKNVHYMRAVFEFFIVVGFFSYAYTVMFPIFASDVLHGTSKTLGFMNGFYGLGAMAGAFVIATIALRRIPNTIFAYVLLHSVFMIFFALSTDYHLSLIFLTVAGYGLVSSLIGTNIYLQSAAIPEMRGRMASLYSIGIYGLGPLGAFLAGLFTEWTSPQTTVIVWASFMILSALIFGFKLKKVNEELKPVWSEFEKN